MSFSLFGLAKVTIHLIQNELKYVCMHIALFHI